jgi:hypothetical protein
MHLLKFMKSPSTQRQFLERRNKLWAALRQLTPDHPEAPALLQELETTIGWTREKILLGLGWDEAHITRDLPK